MDPLYRNGDMGQKHVPCWMTNDAMGQEKQRDDITQKDHILSFQDLSVVASSKVLLYNVTRFCLQRPDLC